jgi:hypothetical protein
MGGACSACGVTRGAIRIWRGSLRGEKTHLEYLGVDGELIMKWIYSKQGRLQKVRNFIVVFWEEAKCKIFF